MFLVSILFSGSFAWLTMASGSLFNIQGVPQAFWPSLYSFVGGVLFGFGAAINGGCGVSTVSRLARGEVVMFITILGWLIGWVVFLPMFSFSGAREVLSLPASSHYLLLIPLSIAIGLAVWRMNRDNRRLWLLMLGIGVMAGLVFVFEPHWTPSGLLKSVSLSIWHQDDALWPEAFRFYLIAALLLGMVYAAVLSKSFELRFFPWKRLVRHLFAGTLMGCGAVLAAGGNDTQLLVAMPALSLAGFASVASIIFGIYLGLKLLR
ncbi:YeeE/YedE thiosulfate transporter family protein [Vibrio tubiashii]|nr:YeeE/YedE thiosulfate transporter family protein [Vibrio tubiashii]